MDNAIMQANAASTAKPWVVLLASMACLLGSGTAYLFGLYSQELKLTLHYNQEQLDSLALAGNLGLFLVMIAGIFVERYGTRRTIMVGSLFVVIGFFLLYLEVKKETRNSVALSFIYFFVVGQGSGWCDTAVLYGCLRIFPEHRGMVSGILKAFIGLSAGFLTQVYNSFFEPDTVNFILFLGCGCAGLMFASALFLAEIDAPARRPVSGGPISMNFISRNLRLGVGGVLGAVAVVTTISVVAALEDVSRTWHIITFATLLIWMLVSLGSLYVRAKGVEHEPLEFASTPSATHVQSQPSDASPTSTTEVDPWKDDAAAQNQDAADRKHPDDAVVTTAPRYEPGQDGTAQLSEEGGLPPPDPYLSVTFANVNFWLAFVASLGVTGAGLTLINNLSQYIASRGGGERTAPTVVSLISCGNALGRLIIGCGSDLLSRWASRRALLVGICASMALCALSLAVTSISLLYPLSLITGVVYGGFWGVLPACLTDMFGVQNFSRVYTSLCLAPSSGALLFATVLAGEIYDHLAVDVNGEQVCTGKVCYRTSFMIIAGMNVLSTLAAFILWRRGTKAESRRRRYSAQVDDEQPPSASQTASIGDHTASVSINHS